MEFNSFLTSHFQAHYKKLLIICTATATIYLIKKYMDRKKRPKAKKEKKKIKEFPTIEEIQKFIEDLPFDAVTSGKSVTLKDLLGELSEFSEDEDWKELIASVHSMYQNQGPANKENEDTGSIMSIYEDTNVITLTSPRDQIVDKSLRKENPEESVQENKGNGDTDVSKTTNISEKKEDSKGLDAVAPTNLGQGDKSESV